MESEHEDPLLSCSQYVHTKHKETLNKSPKCKKYAEQLEKEVTFVKNLYDQEENHYVNKEVNIDTSIKNDTLWNSLFESSMMTVYWT